MKNQKSSLFFIFITILVDVIGIGIIYPVLPKLITELTGESISMASGYGGWLAVSFAAMQFIFSPIMGELSDRFGRRPLLLLSLLGLGIDYIFHALAPTLFWLFIGRIIAGITGASFTVATAYIADISTKENKAKNFGLVGAAFGLGFIIGPVIGGLFAQISTSAPFYFAAGLTLLNLVFGYFVLPESLPENKRRPISFKKMIPGVSLANLTNYKAFGGLLLAFFIANVAGQALPTTWSFFTIELFGWSEAQVGYSLAVVGLLAGITNGFLLGYFVKLFGEYKVIIGGFILWSLGMLGYAFSDDIYMLFFFMIPYILGGIAPPTIQSLLSNRVSELEQGNLQGTLTSLISLSSIIGPLVSSMLFKHFTSGKTTVYFPGAPYASGAVLLFLSTVVVYFALKKLKANSA